MTIMIILDSDNHKEVRKNMAQHNHTWPEQQSKPFLSRWSKLYESTAPTIEEK